MISDADVEALTGAERRALAGRLAAKGPGDLFSDRERVERRRFVWVLTGCCLAMIPWILVLAGRLPRRYTAAHWTLTWVGFDVALASLLALTAWAAWRRRQLFVLTATVTATLLACDAWFDITTSAGGTDTAMSVGSAVLVELPLAAVLLHLGRQLFHGDIRRSRILAGAPEADLPLRRLPLNPRPRGKQPSSGG